LRGEDITGERSGKGLRFGDIYRK